MNTEKRSLEQTAAESEDSHPSSSKPERSQQHKAPTRSRDTTSVRRSEEPGGVLPSLAMNFVSPLPYHQLIYIQVDSADMAPYFRTLFNSLVTVLYPDFEADQQPTVITEDDFVTVCRALVKSRCDYVYMETSGIRPQNQIPLTTTSSVPRALAIIVNGIGTLTINKGGLPVCPRPEDVQANAAQNLDVLATPAMYQSFANLVNSCTTRGFINSSFLSNETTGNAWWLLTARQIDNPTVVANGVQSTATAQGVFREWTPLDAVLCTLVQRQNDGIFGGLNEIFWTSDPVLNVDASRQSFNIFA